MLFINKMKDQLLPEKSCGLSLPPHPTLLTVPALVSLLLGISMDTESQVRPADDTESKTDQRSVHYTEHYSGPCAINRSDDRWSLLFSEMEKRRESIKHPGLVIMSLSGALVTTASSAQTFPILALMTVLALPPAHKACG